MNAVAKAAPAAEVPLTRADLTAAAWRRFEAARETINARKALEKAGGGLTAARKVYDEARAKSEAAMHEHELMEQRMLLQVTA